ncbi:hypothetical protein [Aerosakkonema funiforme]|uniref:Uncharacterized protein n=1 Tax=Aerosakkonema funiforme FACHB-1375 TaxID=2949571 RepID=A0A926VNI9_9CYAN|nr:hypothetical protein [Aerosakkonema funiforme]MBD2186483.1 hypothetical protein [Aerosakkonema funiforme FACHB-1375]
MANLSEQTKVNIFNLLKRLGEMIDEAGKTETVIAEQLGETEITVSTLDDLQNVRERLRNPYTRLCTLYLQISQFQPTAPAAVLDLLYQTIEDAEAAIAASDASIREAKTDFELP